jgi:hypothetical protein
VETNPISRATSCEIACRVGRTNPTDRVGRTNPTDKVGRTNPTAPGAAPNLDPARVRPIVEGEARKAGTRAVLFAAAFDILREVVKYVTPGSPIDF